MEIFHRTLIVSSINVVNYPRDTFVPHAPKNQTAVFTREKRTSRITYEGMVVADGDAGTSIKDFNRRWLS